MWMEEQSVDPNQLIWAGLKISENRHLPCITKIIGIYGGKFYFPIEISKFSLALHPQELVNTSGRVQFSSPAGSILILK